jgi:hypothetical protein
VWLTIRPETVRGAIIGGSAKPLDVGINSLLDEITPERVVLEKEKFQRLERAIDLLAEPTQTSNWLLPQPAIQVAIPAESIFPPGAVPEGINFTAVVSFGPDGSPQQIRLRPRLTGFERSTVQP